MVPAGLGKKGRRQEMYNHDDLQYYGNITVGSQVITAIFDTGSFELVIFERDCSGCGMAGMYSRNLSSTHISGTCSRGIYYGSGDVSTTQAWDMVGIASFPPVNQSFWEGTEAYMPVLQFAKFQSIVGVGPPETPASDAWSDVEASITGMSHRLSKGVFPNEAHIDQLKHDVNYAVSRTESPELVTNINMTTFSVCLGNEPKSNGYLIWDDNSAFEQPELFKRVAVLGRHTWTVNMTHVGFAMMGSDQLTPIGCETSCGAIIDSGTSLLMIPSGVVKLMDEHLRALGNNCSDLSLLPDLVMVMDGKTFSLPPDAYLAEIEGDPPANENEEHHKLISGVPVHMVSRRIGSCHLSVMESYSNTNWGPLWILGMPFFRKYYTTFNIGRNHSDRSLMIAQASPRCTPASLEASLRSTGSARVPRRRLDLSSMYLSPMVRKAMSAGYIEL